MTLLTTLLAVTLLGSFSSPVLSVLALVAGWGINVRAAGLRQGVIFAAFGVAILGLVDAGLSPMVGTSWLLSVSCRGGLLLLVWFVAFCSWQPPRDPLFDGQTNWGYELLDRVRDGCWVVDTDWRTVYINPRILKWLGFAHAEIVEEDFRTFLVKPLNWDTVRDLIDETWKTPKVLSLEFHNHNRSTVELNVVTSPLYAKNGRLIGALLQLEEVTPPQAAPESEWKRSELAGYMKANSSGTLLDANPLFLKTVGYTWDDLKAGRLSWSALVPPDFVPEDSAAELVGSASEARTGLHERQLVRKDGTRVSVLLGITPLEPRSNTWAAIALDLTDRKQWERELRVAKEAAESENKLKDEFLARLSHELRTPLTPILLMASAKLDDPDTPEASRVFFELTRRNLELEMNFIDELLDITRIARGKLQLKRQVVDVHEVIKQAYEICRDDFESAGVHCRFELYAVNSWIVGDAARLQQVFWNLFKNAAKFSPRNGWVFVRTRNEATNEPDAMNGPLVIEVEDQGIGISAELLPRIFQPFEQGEAGKRHPKAGLGLGLAISRTIVAAHGGQLDASSAGLNQGTLFTLCLSTTTRLSLLKRYSGGGHSLARARSCLEILLVEDHAEIREFLYQFLTGHRHRVVAANSLSSAFVAAEGRSFDLLISDIELPDGSGLELMRSLRGHRVETGIALSGFGSDEDLYLSKTAGFAEHLIKPIDVRQLEKAIDAVSQALQTRTSRV